MSIVDMHESLKRRISLETYLDSGNQPLCEDSDYLSLPSERKVYGFGGLAPEFCSAFLRLIMRMPSFAACSDAKEEWSRSVSPKLETPADPLEEGPSLRVGGSSSFAEQMGGSSLDYPDGTVGGEGMKIFHQCVECDRTFGASEDLEQHLTTHVKEQRAASQESPSGPVPLIEMKEKLLVRCDLPCPRYIGGTAGLSLKHIQEWISRYFVLINVPLVCIGAAACKKVRMTKQWGIVGCWGLTLARQDSKPLEKSAALTQRVAKKLKKPDPGRGSGSSREFNPEEDLSGFNQRGADATEERSRSSSPKLESLLGIRWCEREENDEVTERQPLLRVGGRLSLAEEVGASTQNSSARISGAEIFFHECAQCDRTFATWELLEQHLATHVKEDRAACEESGLDLESPSGSIPCQRSTVAFYCKVCMDIFSSEAELTLHMETHSGERSFDCDACGKKFSRFSSLKIHTKVHHPEGGSFECNVCGMMFSKESHVIAHKRTHTRPFECKVCGKRFTTKGNRNSHLRKHEEKPFDCKDCGRAFAQLSALEEHSKIHSVLKRFQCTVCLKRFVSVSDLRTHSRTHTGEKPFVCDICGKEYARLLNLQDHGRTHTGEKPFACDLCGKTFYSHNARSKHKQRSHKTDAL